MEDRRLLIALNASNVTRAALCRLAQTTADWRDARPVDAGRLAGRIGVPKKQVERAVHVKKKGEEIAGRELERATRSGIDILTSLDPAYPAALRDLALPPPVLYLRGNLEATTAEATTGTTTAETTTAAVAIVGSRRMDDYGRGASETFASHLAGVGVAVVSGFARGIDEVAHGAALSVPGGRTFAVLGCGLDVDYPRGRRQLADAVARNGAVISEFPLGASPRPWHFPVRNRVIAALAGATLVVQAKLKSGSLITAHHALELGRDVYAVPGRIFDELSLGTNRLLADGALVAASPLDVLEGLARHGLLCSGLLSRPPLCHGQGQLLTQEPRRAELPPPAEPLPDGPAQKLLKTMPHGQRQTAEDLAGRIELPVDRVLGTLLELELGGWIRREPGPVYVR